MERKIIIGLITSTEFLQIIKPLWDPQFIESTAAKRLAGWCWEYYDIYQKAPGKEIETIYLSKIKDSKFPKDIAEEIEQEILPGLSEEYTREDFNLDHLVAETKKHFSDRHLIIHTESVNALRVSGKIEEAIKLALEYKPLNSLSSDLDKYILSIDKIREAKKSHPALLLKPWLREGQTTILYGNFGSGKSLLTIAVAYMLGLEDPYTEDCEIGPWSIRQPIGTLYIDGELGEQEMEDRVSKFEWLGKQSRKYRIRILSIPEYQEATEDPFYLSLRVNQLKIVQWLKEHPRYKLLVLDSASTLFGLEEENDNSEWNKKINPFLKDLRAIGVACLLLHHSGKDNKKGLRGASAMGAMAHNIFRLVPHPDISIEKGEAWFTLSIDKQRASGFSFKSFSLKFKITDDEKETHWEVTNNY